MSSPYALLSSLWLREPDAGLLARAVAELGLPPAAPVELAPAYSDLLLLNIYPYSTVFTEPEAELNGLGAAAAASRYAAHGYRPADLFDAGAPDHIGLVLGFLDYVDQRGSAAACEAAGAEALVWVPALCLAVQHEPAVPAFYYALAARTASVLLSSFAGPKLASVSLSPAEPGPLPDPAGEVRLRDLVRFFLVPARCGVFLSRNQLGRLAQGLGLAVPFGSRFDVAESVFQAAGASHELPALLDALDALLSAWAAGYNAWSAAYPAWSPIAAAWLQRVAHARQQIALMRAASG